ncbi:hypothetical protein RSAG8_00699, partial [Rhizoctonia solani AG-8 WAC10335]
MNWDTSCPQRHIPCSHRPREIIAQYLNVPEGFPSRTHTMHRGVLGRLAHARLIVPRR